MSVLAQLVYVRVNEPENSDIAKWFQLFVLHNLNYILNTIKISISYHPKVITWSAVLEQCPLPCVKLYLYTSII